MAPEMGQHIPHLAYPVHQQVEQFQRLKLAVEFGLVLGMGHPQEQVAPAQTVERFARAGRVVAQGTPADLRREIFGHSTYNLELAGNIDALLPAVGGM